MSEYYETPLPDGWKAEHTAAFSAYLDAHHDSDSDEPAFGYIVNGVAYCEDIAALDAAISAALQSIL